MFDQAARFAVKLDAAAFFRWLFAHPDPPLVFRGWIDTRRLPLPGEPERTGDAVAEFDDQTVAGRHFALILEIQTEPETEIAERLSLYALPLRRELRRLWGSAGDMAVGAAVLNLTGTPANPVLDMPIPGVPGCGIAIRPLQRNLAAFDAAATLADIAAGKTGRCLLPWIPLMHGENLAAIIAEWKRLAGLEPDPGTRSAYAGLALVFAELSKHLVDWQRGLEGWDMKESQVILGWMREGEEKGALRMSQGGILEVLQARFPPEVPDDLRLAVLGTNDLAVLSRWLRSAATANSLDDFRAAIAQP